MNGRVDRRLVCSSRGMAISDDVERDLSTIVLPQWGCVRADDGPPAWLVVDDGDEAIEPIRRYLRDLVSRGRSSSSVRSYAYDLLRWWRWLRVIDVEWNKATAVDVKDFVLWLMSATKPRKLPRTVSARSAGTVNPVTRKRYLDDSYQARTVRHSNAVVRDFYESGSMWDPGLW